MNRLKDWQSQSKKKWIRKKDKPISNKKTGDIVVSQSNDEWIDVEGMKTKLDSKIYTGPIQISLTPSEKKDLYSTYFNRDSTLKPLLVHSEFKSIFKDMIENSNGSNLGMVVEKNVRIDLNSQNAMEKYMVFSNIMAKLHQTKMDCTIKPISSISLLAWIPGVYNQGFLGSCYANAISQLINIHRCISLSLEFSNIELNEILDYVWGIRPSRQFIEYNCDRLQTEVVGDTVFTQGAYDWSAMESIVRFGAPPEIVYDYAKLNTMSVSQFKSLSESTKDDLLIEFYQKQMIPPDSYVYERAKYEKDLKSLHWYNLSNPSLTPFEKDFLPFEKLKMLICQYLSAKIPLYFGMPVFRSWYQLASHLNSVVPLLKDDELMGYHALVIVGFDSKYIEVVNSWGAKSGKQGLFKIPWEYLKTHLIKCVVIVLASKEWNHCKSIKFSN